MRWPTASACCFHAWVSSARCAVLHRLRLPQTDNAFSPSPKNWGKSKTIILDNHPQFVFHEVILNQTRHTMIRPCP